MDCFVLLLIVTWAQYSLCVSAKPIKIAIVGAGIGGTSTAYFLRQLFRDKQLEIHIYESGEVGGRLSTIKIAGREYETGGSILHGSNRLMIELLNATSLERADAPEDMRFSIMDDKNKIIFQQTPYLGILQILNRYGILSLMKISYTISSLQSSFSKIYDFLDSGKYFFSSKEFLKTISPESRYKSKAHINKHAMLNLTTMTLEDFLKEQNFESTFIKEFASAATRCNYGQSIKSLHAFVGAVALAGAESSLWSVRGGNKRIPEELIRVTNSKLIKGRVDSVYLSNTTKQYRVHSRLSNSCETHDESLTVSKAKFKKQSCSSIQDHIEEYDAVIIAAPLATNVNEGIKLPRADSNKGQYHKIITTLIHGNPSPNFFKGADSSFFLYPEDDSVINSINRLEPVDYKKGENIPSVWKIFSQRELRIEEIRNMFSDVKDIKVVRWLAYPRYKRYEFIDEEFEIKKGENLFYLNGFEWVASAMEMSAIAAKNVANIVYTNLIS